MTILFVERRAHQAVQIADWCYVLVAGRVMPTHGDRITMIRHMVLLSALGAGAFGGRQRGDGFQLRLVLERGNPPSPTANHASCVGLSQPATSAPTPHHTISGTCDSKPSPSSNERAIQRDPNEVIIRQAIIVIAG